MTIPSDTMRAEFEAFCAQEKFSTARDPDGSYRWIEARTAWLAWQASAEAERGRVAAPDEMKLREILAEECDKQGLRARATEIRSGLLGSSHSPSFTKAALAALNRTAAQQET